MTGSTNFDVDRSAMQMNAGVANLLRSARSECGGLVAFVAVDADDDGAEPCVATFPDGGGAEQLGRDAVGEMVRQSWLDPEFRHGRPFVRGVGFDVPLTLAVAPLGDGAGRGMVGVVAPGGHAFEPLELASLDRVAQRMARHLRARSELLERLPAAAADGGAHGWTAPGERGPEGSASQASDAMVPPSSPDGSSVRSPVAQAERTPPERATDRAATACEPRRTGSPDPSARGWAEPDELAGLAGLGQFFSRAGRLFAGSAEATAVAVIVVEVGPPEAAAIRAAARALRGQLRFSDPLARISRGTFASVVALFPGSTRGDVVEARLEEAVRATLGDAFTIRSTHVVAKPGDGRELDELLHHALAALRAC